MAIANQERVGKADADSRWALNTSVAGMVEAGILESKRGTAVRQRREGVTHASLGH